MPVAKLSSRLTLKDRAFWFGEIELREDQIVISGWTWNGPLEKKIPIRRVTTFETWWGGQDRTNFQLVVEEGAPIRGRIEKGKGRWEAKMKTDERVDLKRRV